MIKSWKIDKPFACIESGPHFCRTETMVFVYGKQVDHIYQFVAHDGPYPDGYEPLRIYQGVCRGDDEC
jgi:hypothetical protein